MENVKVSTTIWSRISIFFSSLCLVHCMVHPFVIMLLPLASEFVGHTMENIFIIMVVPVSLVGFIPTWLNHRNIKLISYFSLGLVILVAAQFLIPENGQLSGFGGTALKTEYFKSLFIFIGAGFLAWSTFKNSRHTHICKNPHHIHESAK